MTQNKKTFSMFYSLADNKITNPKSRNFAYFVLTLGLLAILFQVGHFFEHIIQVVAWVGGYRERPYMTEFGMFLVNSLGDFFYGAQDAMRRTMLGMEALHLIGNTIFLAGMATMYYFLRVRLMAIGLAIQIFHFYEHVSLTSSLYITGKAIGLSTLYGTPMDQYAITAYRVWWHFIFNAVPTAFVLSALFIYYRTYRNRKTY